jgi:hypothetical protein
VRRAVNLVARKSCARVVVVHIGSFALSIRSRTNAIA